MVTPGTWTMTLSLFESVLRIGLKREYLQTPVLMAIFSIKLFDYRQIYGKYR